MKIATKKVLLGILAAFCAVCIGAFVGFSLNGAKTAVADDPTVVNLTFNAVGINGHNDKSGVYGITRVTALRFTDDQDSSNTGVFSGNSDGVYNWDNLIANTTYTGSGAYIYAPANVTWTSGYSIIFKLINENLRKQSFFFFFFISQLNEGILICFCFNTFAVCCCLADFVSFFICFDFVCHVELDYVVTIEVVLIVLIEFFRGDLIHSVFTIEVFHDSG